MQVKSGFPIQMPTFIDIFSILYFQLFVAIYFENSEDVTDFVLLKFSTSYLVTSNMTEFFFLIKDEYFILSFLFHYKEIMHSLEQSIN